MDCGGDLGVAIGRCRSSRGSAPRSLGGPLAGHPDVGDAKRWALAGHPEVGDAKRRQTERIALLPRYLPARPLRMRVRGIANCRRASMATDVAMPARRSRNFWTDRQSRSDVGPSTMLR